MNVARFDRYRVSLGGPNLPTAQFSPPKCCRCRSGLIAADARAFAIRDELPLLEYANVGVASRIADCETKRAGVLESPGP